MSTSTAHTNSAEYGTVIRLTTTATPIGTYSYPSSPPHHTLIRGTEPLRVRQYCRTMTLAQGRLLYEVWDTFSDRHWQPRCVGYIVPSHVADEGRKVSVLYRGEEWRGLPKVVVGRYEETWRNVVEAWPGLPVFGARRVVERLIREREGRGRGKVEREVKRYALRHWSDYKVRLEAEGWGADDRSLEYWKVEKEVHKAVAGRVMEVLRSWMRLEVSFAKAEEMFERLELIKVEKKSYRGVLFD